MNAPKTFQQQLNLCVENALLRMGPNDGVRAFMDTLLRNSSTPFLRARFISEELERREKARSSHSSVSPLARRSGIR